MKCHWEEITSGDLQICVTQKLDETATKVASFDLDWTLIKTKSGKVFGKDSDDWILWDVSIKNILENLVQNNYMIVLFTNQIGLGTLSGKSKLNGFKKKIENIIDALNVPMQVFVSTSNGLYRKPSPGMWFLMKTRQKVPIDLKESFYVGDAAGRPLNWKLGKKADFAATDRMFAINIGLKFYTPEEYFLNEKTVPYTEIKFHPWQYDKDVKLPDLGLPSVNQEVIIMVGSPGSGKSHFVKFFIEKHGYHIVSRDMLGSYQKCVRLLEDALKSKRSAVIDNTNPDRVSRQRFLEICKKHQVKVRCFFINSSLDRCLHNNKFREIIDPTHEIIAMPIINIFHKDFEKPLIEEGFSSIVNLSFVPKFENEQHKYFYNCYLLSK